MNRDNKQNPEAILGLEQESFEISFDNLSVEDQLAIIAKVDRLLKMLQPLKSRTLVWTIIMAFGCMGYLYLITTQEFPVAFFIIPFGLMIYFLLWLARLHGKDIALQEKKRYIDLNII